MTMNLPNEWEDASWWAQRTTADIELLRGQLKASVRRWTVVHVFLCGCTGAAITTLVSSLLAIDHFDLSATAGGYLAFGGAGIAALLVVLLSCLAVRDARKWQLDSLEPLRDRSTCEYVMGLLREPQVLAYRDRVVSTRQELLGVDKGCMAAIMKRVAQASVARQMEELRKKMHSFVPEATAPGETATLREMSVPELGNYLR